MKTLRKYANMAFLLVSVATIVPAYANPVINEQEKVKQEKITVEPKKTKTVWYKKPEVRETIKKTLKSRAVVGCGIGLLALMYYTAIPALPKVNTAPTKQSAQGENAGSNIIDNVIVLGQIIQTDGKNTTVVTPDAQPISVKQDKYGTWVKKNGSDWTLIKKSSNTVVIK